MSLLELKEQLHQNIEEINDEDFLNQVNLLLSQQAEAENLNDHQKKALNAVIQEALKQVEDGKTISYEEIKEKYAKWFLKSGSLQ